MTHRARTLLLYATNVPNGKRLVTDTLREGLKIDVEKMPALLRGNAFFQRFFKQGYRSLSYVMDWYDAFLRSPDLEIDPCNINNLPQLIRAMRRIASYDMIVILHSAAGDHMRTLLWLTSFFQRRKGKLVVCFGNEYVLMPQKLAFAQSTGADFIVSQLPKAPADWLYSDCKKSHVILAPAALNPELYRPLNRARVIDIGFRGSAYSYSIGDVQRSLMIERLNEHAMAQGLRCDIDYRLVDRTEWSEFLNTCRGIPGAESGTYFLEKDDHTQNAVQHFLKGRPRASFQEIHERFFKDYRNPFSGKAISSRHFEPVGTHTCQLLLEGDYNGIFQRDVHYIGVKKDFSDIDDALRRFTDADYRDAMVKRTYDLVIGAHTYAHRVKSILAAVI